MRRIRRTEGSAGGVRAEWFEPSGSAGGGDGVVLFFHGGSFIYGSTVSHGEMIARLALATSAKVLALDYRLAPESPFPAALDDATAAYRWLLGQGIPPSRIVLAGDSAGGNLTVATLLSLRDQGTPLPAGAIPICPWVDLARTGGSLDANAAYDWGFPDDFQLWASTYAGPTPLTSPLVSPARADLSGLPPLHVLWGSREMLRDQVVDFCARARDAGVDVHADEYADMVHNWIVLHALTPEAERAYQAMGRFVRRVTR
jgi:acetyl esterase/lipase